MKEGRTWRLCCQWTLASGHREPQKVVEGEQSARGLPPKLPVTPYPASLRIPRDKVPTVAPVQRAPQYYLNVSRILWRRQRLFAGWTFYPDTAGPFHFFVGEGGFFQLLCSGKKLIDF